MNANLPLFEIQKKLTQNVFPSDWVNPQPKVIYDLLVLGGGPGGMSAATLASHLGAQVALVEKEHLGGECLNYGCIPSKAFLRSSRAAHQLRHAHEYGLEISSKWAVNFKAVINRVQTLQAELSPHDSAEHFKSLGIDVFLGSGKFTSPNTLEVAGHILHFKKALVATGTQPILPRIPGLDPSDYLTNQNVFHQEELPARLAVIGAGPISCELSQAFLRFGSRVYLLTHGPHLLSKEEKSASDLLKSIFLKEGIHLFMQTNVLNVKKQGKEKFLFLDSSKDPLVVDQILVGIGRRAVVEDLGLEKAGVVFDALTGIRTDDYLKTDNPDIYAAGDVASPYKFTHISTELCSLAVRNALEGSQEKKTSLIIPWCTYTDPEIAHIGLTEEDALKKGLAVETSYVDIASIDRALLDGETMGYAKLIVKENSEQILGATLIASHAGEMIPEIGVAMNSAQGLSALLKTIHPFPTQSQVLRSAAALLLEKRRPAKVLH